MNVALRDPRTGRSKVLPAGWSWRCFIGSFILGVPLFRLGLPLWGALMVAFNVVALVIALVPSGRAASLDGWVTVIGLGLSLFLGLKANEMVIGRHLTRGWEYAEPRGKPGLTQRD